MDDRHRKGGKDVHDLSHNGPGVLARPLMSAGRSAYLSSKKMGYLTCLVELDGHLHTVVFILKGAHRLDYLLPIARATMPGFTPDLS